VNIAIFNWRDLGHPKHGGAEVATNLLATQLARRGHRVTWVSSSYPGAPPLQSGEGYDLVRFGNEVTCRFHALSWLRRQSDVDVAIDEVNTLPFLSRLAMPDRVVVWMLQLAREVWLAEAPPVIGHIGYVAEPALLSLYRRSPIVTISQSSAASFRKIGMRGTIDVAEIMLQPPLDQTFMPEPGLIGFVGRLAPSKRIDHIISAVALLSERMPQARLLIIGSGPAREEARLRRKAAQLGVSSRVTFAGRVSSAERDRMMSEMDVLTMTSMREGWGLVVSEAARFGVPSIVYPVAGVVDSVVDGRTGLVTQREQPRDLALALERVVLNRTLRERLGRSAAEYLREFNEDRFVGRFESVLERVAKTT
jgi:glycosyltransferase involved in cell wall biosynthesis